MGNDFKLTIVTPTYNAEKDIEACILSVANQTYGNKEHLIIDGLSVDATVEIARHYEKLFPHLRVFSEKDDGIYDAMNKGIDLARGEWVYFIGCDDLLLSTKTLEEIFNINEVDLFDVVYGNVVWGDTGRTYGGKFSLLKLMTNNICHQSIFYKKSVFDKYGKYDTKYKLVADHVFNMMLINNDNVKIRYIDKTIAKYGINGISAIEKDDNFMNDKEDIIKKYFPIEYYELYCKLEKLETDIITNYNALEHARDEITQLELQLKKHNINWRSIVQKIKDLF